MRWFISVILLCAASNTFATDAASRVVFEEKYQAWKEWVKEHGFMSTYIANEPFHAIVQMGLPAIPLLAEKIEKNPEDFELGTAIGIISKRRFAQPEWPQDKLGDSITAARMYVRWWKEGRFKTGERFDELYPKWKALKLQKKDAEAHQTFQQIVDLGIPVLPYLVDKVEQDSDFIPAISKLSDGAIPPTATAAECKQWWNKNQQKFELPPQSSSNDSSDKKGGGWPPDSR